MRFLCLCNNMATREVFDCSAPALNFFNRQESFRNCGGVPNPQTIDEYAQKGWYCSNIDHQLRCINCKDTPGRCNGFGWNLTELVCDCDVVTGEILSVNLDSFHDSIKFCTNPPVKKKTQVLDSNGFEVNYSSLEERTMSFNNYMVPKSLWNHIGRWAFAGFYFAGNSKYYFLCIVFIEQYS